jgi:hypothetical protein
VSICNEKIVTPPENQTLNKFSYTWNPNPSFAWIRSFGVTDMANEIKDNIVNIIMMREEEVSKD